MKIGIDFGSTYSTVAHYNAAKNQVEAIAPAEGEPVSIPSVVSIAKKSGKVTCGKGAKGQAGKKSVRMFEAFKMLLTENPDSNSTILADRGYDNQYTPKEITRLFLKSTLTMALGREGDTRFENMVICVPEIWGKNINTLDGRMVLKEILTEENLGMPIDHVRIVTEPEAASAYFAYDYEHTTHKRFNGHLLLIDYGGGTLDITLTEVSSDGRGAMEIGYREGGGAGENHPSAENGSTIGSAGIAYMQAVVALALRAAGILGGNEAPDYTSPYFISCVCDLETQLKSADQIIEIEDTFGSYGKYSKMSKILQDDPKEFHTIEYQGEEVPVYYQHLYQAYKDTIEDVLKQQVGGINKKVQVHIGTNPCEASSGDNDDFKIALVGGFGSFYLVKQQIAEIYNFDTNSNVDPRTKNISASQRELAISLGAALLASEKIVLQKTARYSIGMCTKDEKNLYYGIRYHQTIEPGKAYFLLTDSNGADVPENRVTWGNLAGEIKYFAIEFSDFLNRGGLMELKPEMLDKLKNLPVEGFWNCGFSMDENDIVTFHVVPKIIPGFNDNSKGIEIRLASYSKMFNLTAVREVII